MHSRAHCAQRIARSALRAPRGLIHSNADRLVRIGSPLCVRASRRGVRAWNGGTAGRGRQPALMWPCACRNAYTRRLPRRIAAASAYLRRATCRFSRNIARCIATWCTAQLHALRVAAVAHRPADSGAHALCAYTSGAASAARSYDSGARVGVPAPEHVVPQLEAPAAPRACARVRMCVCACVRGCVRMRACARACVSVCACV
jgi:hypothetical protein